MARILFVSTSTTVGGAEKTLFALATLLDHRRYPVAGVVSLKPEGHYARLLTAQGVKTESLNSARAPSPSDAKRLASIIERERPDIVHAVMYQAIQLARMAKPLTSVPFKLVSSPRVNYRSRSLWTLLVDRWLKVLDNFGDMSAGPLDPPLLATAFGATAVTICKTILRPLRPDRNGIDGCRDAECTFGFAIGLLESTPGIFPPKRVRSIPHCNVTGRSSQRGALHRVRQDFLAGFGHLP